MVLAGNCIEYIQLFFATTAIGAVFVVIDVNFTTEEVVKAVDFVGMSFILARTRTLRTVIIKSISWTHRDA